MEAKAGTDSSTGAEAGLVLNKEVRVGADVGVEVGTDANTGTEVDALTGKQAAPGAKLGANVGVDRARPGAMVCGDIIAGREVTIGTDFG